jgi:hypothetical protein
MKQMLQSISADETINDPSQKPIHPVAPPFIRTIVHYSRQSARSKPPAFCLPFTLKASIQYKCITHCTIVFGALISVFTYRIYREDDHMKSMEALDSFAGVVLKYSPRKRNKKKQRRRK